MDIIFAYLLCGPAWCGYARNRSPLFIASLKNRNKTKTFALLNTVAVVYVVSIICVYFSGSIFSLSAPNIISKKYQDNTKIM